MSLGLYRDLSLGTYGGFTYIPSQYDNVPDTIEGQIVENSLLGATVEHYPVQVTGIDVTVLVSIIGGEFRVSADGISYDEYSTDSRQVENTYWVQVRTGASSFPSTSTVSRLLVADQEILFTVVTHVPILLAENISINRLTHTTLPRLSRHLTYYNWTKY